VQAAAAIACAAAGAIPQLGFIHEDSGQAFVLDVADLYRDSVTLQAAFWAAAQSSKVPAESVDRLVRRRLATIFRTEQLIPTMIDKIKALFGMEDAT
jgi:CRISPR-associated protein Cas1